MNWVLEGCHEDVKKWHKVYGYGEAGMKLETALEEMVKHRIANPPWWQFRVRNTETGETIPGALLCS
ncbi:MAG: hypothetical protein MN733_35150 [Nitrososphaera sp.]|nr:hypothetical protein [Nitrososphaera sp.]